MLREVYKTRLEGKIEMADHITSSDIVVRPVYDTQLLDFENTLLLFLQECDLPTESVFIPIPARTTVFNNLKNVLTRISQDKRRQSQYLSKFVAAVASGLFDAALSFLWNETIAELRHRVAQYDLSYFYDNAVSNAEKRKLKNEEDLVNISDSELIEGARAIGLITEIGYKRLQNIMYMRNWASAAHPNQVELTGYDLINWLETCMIHVISPELSPITLHIGQLLSTIKTTSIDEAKAEKIGIFFEEPPNREQVNKLVLGLFGIYTRTDTTQQTRQNIHHLLPHLWHIVDETTRSEIGIKYGKFAVNGDQEAERLAYQFLGLVSGLSYIPDNFLVVEIKTAIENLLNAHRNFGNFYNEPPFARELKRLVGEVGKVPPKVNKVYVTGLVEVFLTNGYGEVWGAEPIYRSLLNLFDSTQALIAILSFTDITIASRLELPLCQQKYRELLEIMKDKVSEATVLELISEIENYKGTLDRMKDDTRLKHKISALLKIRK